MAVRAVTTGVTPLPATETVDDGPNPVPVTVTGAAVAPWPRTFGATEATLGAVIFEIVTGWLRPTLPAASDCVARSV